MAKAKAGGGGGGGGALIAWDEQLLADANLARAGEESVMLGSFISFRGGQMTFNGNTFPNNKASFIVLDSVLENVWYAEKWKPDSPASPACYAFGRLDAEMKPHEKAEDPQNATCKGCPMNEWESADEGRGKACKNSRRLALIPADESLKSADTMKDANIAFARIPVTSVKAWAGYVTQLANVTKKPPYAVVTEIMVTTDPKTQFKVSFKLVRSIDDRHVQQALLEKVQQARSSIIFPYAPREAAAEPARGKAKPRAGKFRR